MYATQIGETVREQGDRFAAYKAAWLAVSEGYFNVYILKDNEIECKIKKEPNGGIKLFTPSVDDKWHCSTFLREVNGLR